MTEEWKPIPDWSEYEASSLGNIRRIEPTNGVQRGKALNPTIKPDGRPYVSLSRNGKATKFHVCRLVNITFNGPPPTPFHETAHEDGNNQNNAATNIRWATKLENTKDKIKHGRILRGTDHPGCKLKPEDVIEIRRLCASGMAQQKIAALYSIHQVHVSEIKLRKLWRHLD